MVGAEKAEVSYLLLFPPLFLERSKKEACALPSATHLRASASPREIKIFAASRLRVN
jgi:hypothetical protein